MSSIHFAEKNTFTMVPEVAAAAVADSSQDIDNSTG